MILNKKTRLLQKVMTFSLLLTFAQGSLSLAAGDSTVLKSGIGETAIINMNNYDRPVDMSTLKLNGISKITDSKEKVSISLRDSDVQQVLRMLADKAGLSIVFHDSVGSASSGGSGGGPGGGSGGASGGKKITLDLVNTTINDAFLLVLDTCSLSYYLDGNVLTVATKGAIGSLDSGKQNLTVLAVKYVDASDVTNFLNSNVFASNITGLSGGAPVTVNPRTNEIMIFGTKNDVEVAKKVLAKLDTKPMMNTFKVNHVTPKEMANLICTSVLNAEGGSSASGGSSSSSGGGDLVLGGGEVACKIVANGSGSGGGSGGSGSTSSKTPFGKNAISVTYFPQRGTISVLGGSIEQVDIIKQFIGDNDKKQLMAYLELSIVELNEKGSKEFNNYWRLQTPFADFNFTNDGRASMSEGTLFYDMNEKGFKSFLPGEVIRAFERPTADQLDKEIYYKMVQNTGTSLRYSVDMAIENGNGRSLSNPKIMVTNGQVSTIDLSADYVKTVKTQIDNSTGMVPIVTREYTTADDLGLKIEVTPFISLDGYVSLNLKPEYTTKLGEVKATQSDGEITYQDLVATLLQKRKLDLKNLRIKDGETLVLAGMVSEDEAQVVKKVPVLGDLPLIGVLFRQSSNVKNKSELVIMITPHIIYDDEQLANIKKETL